MVGSSDIFKASFLIVDDQKATVSLRKQMRGALSHRVVPVPEAGGGHVTLELHEPSARAATGTD